MASSHSPTIKVPWISCAPDQPQYDISRHFFGPSVNLLHLSVFKLPDELILSILSHIRPDLRVTGHCAWFRISYRMETKDCHHRRTQFLRRLSMTCRAMWLRFVPWVWERVELPSSYHWYSGSTFAGKLNAFANALHAEVFLTANLRYFLAILCPRVGADSCPLEIHNAGHLPGWDLSFVRQMLKISPKSPYARDKMDAPLSHDTAPKRT